MLVKFKKTGQVSSIISDDYWGQGENNTDVLQVQFYSNAEETTYYNLSAYTVECVVERPDGVISPSLVMSTITLSGIKTAQLSINNWITEVAGNLKFIIRLKQTLAGVTSILTTGVCYKVVGEGINPADSTITEAEKQAIEDSIQALDDRLDTAEEDIDGLETSMGEAQSDILDLYSTKVDCFVNNNNTCHDLYEIVEQKPAVVKVGNTTLILQLTPYSNYYWYSAIAIENSSPGNVAKVWARTGATSSTSTTLSTIASDVKQNDYRMQSKKDITTLIANYYTKSEVDTTISNIKTNQYQSVNTTTYPTLASFLASTGTEGYMYLYPIDVNDLTKGYYRYIWENSTWLVMGSTDMDLTTYAKKADVYDKTHSYNKSETNLKLLEKKYTDTYYKAVTLVQEYPGYNSYADITNWEGQTYEENSGPSIVNDIYTNSKYSYFDYPFDQNNMARIISCSVEGLQVTAKFMLYDKGQICNVTTDDDGVMHLSYEDLGSGRWGAIGGTISDQTDLMSIFEIVRLG